MTSRMTIAREGPKREGGQHRSMMKQPIISAFDGNAVQIRFVRARALGPDQGGGSISVRLSSPTAGSPCVFPAREWILGRRGWLS